ncbi:ABC transporter permease [Arthrobacter sp. H14]|uniref:ABC transporter permease n=1 Tax=Arthrobacter sp. H14 TaxID=1312959 RepID=UPI0004ACD5E5|nr:iron ABC transporter permease [Arthrobacter sp. H14]
MPITDHRAARLLRVPERPGEKGKRSAPPAAVLVPAVLVTLTALIPLGFVITMTVATGWEDATYLIFRPRVGELAINTVSLIALTVPLTVLIGIGTAWLVERTNVPGARAWALLLAAPLAVPAYVNSYAWISTIPTLAGVWSGVLISVLSYFPLVYIPAAATLRRLDPALEHSAASLGLGPWSVFFRVVVPQLRLAVVGGALLVSLHLLAEYGAFSMIRFSTFTTAIMGQYQSTFNGAAANMLAGVLVLFCLFLLLTESRGRGTAHYARLGSGVAAAPVPARLGRWRLPAVGALAAVIALALGVPLVNIARWLIAGGAEVWTAGPLAGALVQTLGYGFAGAAVTTVLAFPVAWLAVRHPSRFTRILEGTNYVASSMPGIVVALALVTVTISFVQPIYQSTAVVVAAYVLLFLPRALIPLRAGIAQAPPALEEAARALGKAPPTAFLKVTLRLCAPAAAGGAALVFLGVVNELTATLLLSPSGTWTLATRFWSLSGEIDYAGAAPYALLMVLLSLPVTYLLYTQSQKAAGR